MIQSVPKCVADFLNKKKETKEKKKEYVPEIPFSVYFQEEMKKVDKNEKTRRNIY